MRGQRLMFVVLTSALAGSIALAQPGRGGSQWLTALGDAQRTSWVRSDDKISVAALSKPGFELQWKAKLDNQPRGVHGLTQGVTASGVTLFVPMSVVAGSSNNVYGIDNDLGYVVWQRHFDAALPASTPGCAGGITAGATRIVSLSPLRPRLEILSAEAGRGVVGYRSLLGQPGEGVPVEGRAAGPGRVRRSVRCRAVRGRRRREAPAGASRRGRTRRGASACPGCPGKPGRRADSRARRGGRRTPTRGAFSSGPPVSATRCRATACCTWSALRPARTFSAPRPSCPRIQNGPHRWRWTRRCTRRHRGSAAARQTGCGRSIWTATRSRSCRGRRTAGE